MMINKSTLVYTSYLEDYDLKLTCDVLVSPISVILSYINLNSIKCRLLKF